MRKTIREQIDANKRGSFVLVCVMLLLLTALGACIVGIWRPNYWAYGAIGAFCLGLLSGVIARFSGPGIILAISGGREATTQEDQVLRNVVEEMAIAGGIPMPKIYVIDDPAPNAFATGTSPENGIVCITTGLMSKLNRDELQGVMAHEISHIRNYDIRYMTMVTVMAGMIVLLADILQSQLRWGFFFGRSRSNNNNNNDNPLGIVFLILGIVLAILGPVMGWMLELAVSRKREFLADAGAAELTRYPEGLISALRKISNDPNDLQSANRATQSMYFVNPLKLLKERDDLTSDHPSTQARINALMGLEPYYQNKTN